MFREGESLADDGKGTVEAIFEPYSVAGGTLEDASTLDGQRHANGRPQADAGNFRQGWFVDVNPARHGIAR